VRRRDPLHQPLGLQTVADEVGDGHHEKPVRLAELRRGPGPGPSTRPRS
jgi:hypothetical protein